MLLIHVVARCFVLYQRRPRPAARPRRTARHQSRFQRPRNSTTAAAAASCLCLSCWAWAWFCVGRVADCSSLAMLQVCVRAVTRQRVSFTARSDALEVQPKTTVGSSAREVAAVFTALSPGPALCLQRRATPNCRALSRAGIVSAAAYALHTRELVVLAISSVTARRRGRIGTKTHHRT